MYPSYQRRGSRYHLEFSAQRLDQSTIAATYTRAYRVPQLIGAYSSRRRDYWGGDLSRTGIAEGF